MRNIYTGVVENRNDPLKLGRCQVRVVGLHTEDKTILPTTDLPWAFPMQPITSASVNGIGWTPVGPVPGTWVVVMFHDDEFQMPVMIGTLGGIPQSKAAEKVLDNSDNLVTDGGIVTDADGNATKSASGVDIIIGSLIPGLSDNTKTVLGQIVNTLGLGGLLGNPLAGSTRSPTIGSDNNREKTITPKIVPPAEAKIDSQPQPAAAVDEVIAKEIPIEPPAKYARDKSQAKQAIQAIIKYCDQMGFTSKYAKCSIIAICGGESGWAPLEEGYSYSKDALLQVFPGVFKGDQGKATQYARWKGSRADFFRFIYSPKYRNGKGVGNIQEDDGALFYGRGFVQITGRAGYEGVQKELKKYGIQIDIVNNPQQVISSVDICAAVAVGFYKMKQTQRILKVSQDDPNFIEAALRATGNDAVVNGHSGYAKKRAIYQYFLGQGVITDSTNKPVADEQRIYTEAEVVNLPASKRAALLEDRSDVETVGFKDPTGKYPLRNLLDEPDTNRLARGVIQDTAVAFKDQSRTKGIGTANEADDDWEQPLAPFGGQYPYAKVFESESGHIQVFDDTPGNEYISLYHRTGTFIDIDANGTQVNKIIGDGYTIIDRNGMIQITGRCNIYVGNNANIKVEGNLDLEVNGATAAIFHGDVEIGCARNVDWAIGGDLNLKVGGNFSTNVGGNAMTLITGSEIYETAGNYTKKIAGTQATEAAGAITLKAGADITTTAKGKFNLKAEDEMLLTGKVQHIKASGGNVNVDGIQFRGQQGSANTAPNIKGEIAAATALTLTAPELMPSSGNKYEILTTPVRPSQQVEITGPLNGDDSDAGGHNAAAAADDIAETRAPQPKVPGVDTNKGEPPAQGMQASDIETFLKKIYDQAQEGHWSEIGMKDKVSCAPAIKRLWDDIGLSGVPKNGVQFRGKLVKGDQVPWCAAFVNWTLKQCGHHWASDARAYGFTENPGRWNATKVTSDPQPGDVVVWNYSHVNFVYEVLPNGTFTCIGGNQGSGKSSDNNPIGGLVTVNNKGGTTLANKNIKAVFRIPKGTK